MKNNSLGEIVDNRIDLSKPIPTAAAFDKILIVVPAPTAKGNEKKLTKAFTIGKADDLLEYGFKTDEVAYTAAEVAFAQKPSPDELVICVRGKAEEPKNTLEDIKLLLTRANEESFFYGFHITSFRDEADVKAAIEWAESNNKLFCFECSDVENIPVKNFSYFRSFGLFSGQADGFEKDKQPITNSYAALAMMAICFGYDPGTETWAFKELSGIVPSLLSNSDKKTLKDKNLSTFLRYAGSNITSGGKTLGGEWIDVIRFMDWLHAQIQINVFNVLKVNKKVPTTDEGIGLIEGAVTATLLKAQDIGGLAPDEFDKDGNKIPGFTVKMPKALSLSEADRKNRTLPGCEYSGRLAGAFHFVTLRGKLTF